MKLYKYIDRMGDGSLYVEEIDLSLTDAELIDKKLIELAMVVSKQDPFTDNDMGDMPCFYCGFDKLEEKHSEDCAYLKSIEIIDDLNKIKEKYTLEGEKEC